MKEQIRKYIKTVFLGKNIFYEPQMESTNRFAKCLGEENQLDEAVVITEQQTAGKGRKGRIWISPKGNCYFSVLLRPQIRPEHASRITLVAALALTKAIQQVSGLDVRIKWPNDVVVDGKKLCGILTEGSTDADGLKYIVVGIGINVNQMEFDAEIQDKATSIRLQTGKRTECAQLVGMVLNHFEEYYQRFLETEDLSDMMKEYNNLLVNKDCEVKLIGENERIVTAIGIDETGGLVVKGEDGVVETVISGEVSVRGLYGYV